MKAVILAAGEGQRMRPLTSTRPKVMLPLANRPILEHIILQAKAAEISEFVLVVGYFSDAVRKYFGTGERLGVSITYARQAQQRGTAHAISTAREHIDGDFIVLNGDVLISTDDIRNIIGKNTCSMAVKIVDDTRGYGVVTTENRDGVLHITRIEEKPQSSESKVINSGIYRFDDAIFNAIDATPLSKRGEYEITTTLQMLIDTGSPVIGCELDGAWLDVGMPWDLLDAHAALMKPLSDDIRGEVEAGATIHGPVHIGENTIIRAGAYIVGPVIIGDGCDIGPNCFIRPTTAIGHRCRIGNGVEVKNSVIMDGSHIAHLSYVGDSVIGRDCNLGAGTMIANLRHDSGDIDSVIKGTRISSGRRKLGAVIGDDVKTGINSTIDVGTIIGEGARIGPGALVRGSIAPHTKVF